MKIIYENGEFKYFENDEIVCLIGGTMRGGFWEVIRLERFTANFPGAVSKVLNHILLNGNGSIIPLAVHSSFTRSADSEKFWSKFRPDNQFEKFKIVFRHDGAPVNEPFISEFAFGEVKIIERTSYWIIAKDRESARKFFRSENFRFSDESEDDIWAQEMFESLKDDSE